MATGTRLRWWVHLLRIVMVVVASVGLSLGLSAVYSQTLGDQGLAVAPDEKELIDRINAIRAKASCPPVTANPSLVAAAQAQADDMVNRGFLSPVNPDNQDPAFRARAFGYAGDVTESFAAGLTTPAEVADQWVNPDNPYAAPVSRRIRNCDAVSIGIGHNTGTPLPGFAGQVWVMTLGDT